MMHIEYSCSSKCWDCSLADQSANHGTNAAVLLKPSRDVDWHRSCCFHVVFLLQAAVFHFNHFRQRQAQGDLPETCTSQQLATSQGSARSLFSSADANRNGPELCWNRWDKTVTQSGEKFCNDCWALVFRERWERQDRNRFNRLNRSYLIWFGNVWKTELGIDEKTTMALASMIQFVRSSRSSPSFQTKGTQGLSWDWRQFGVVLQYLIYSNLLYSN